MAQLIRKTIFTSTQIVLMQNALKKYRKENNYTNKHLVNEILKVPNRKAKISESEISTFISGGSLGGPKKYYTLFQYCTFYEILSPAAFYTTEEAIASNCYSELLLGRGSNGFKTKKKIDKLSDKYLITNSPPSDRLELTLKSVSTGFIDITNAQFSQFYDDQELTYLNIEYYKNNKIERHKTGYALLHDSQENKVYVYIRSVDMDFYAQYFLTLQQELGTAHAHPIQVLSSEYKGKFDNNNYFPYNEQMSGKKTNTAEFCSPEDERRFFEFMDNTYVENVKSENPTIDEQLFWAVDDQDIDAVKQALDNGANPNYVNQGCETTPMILAGRYTNFEIIEELMKTKKCDLSARDAHGLDVYYRIPVNQKDRFIMLVKKYARNQMSLFPEHNKSVFARIFG